MTRLLEDRELLARFRDGQRGALDAVYRHYAPQVANFLRSGFMYSTQGQPARFPGVHSPFELESMVQEVFLRAFAPQARMRYDGLRPYAGFLRGIARNIVLDELRRWARGAELAAPVAALERAAAAGGANAAAPAWGAAGAEAGGGFEGAPEASIDEQRARALVSEFLTGECDDRDRRLYELRYDRELSQEAAAQTAGLTRIQVRRWETKFRKRLLRYLKRAHYVR